MATPDLRLLFHILESERSILSRTDQKALTLLSVLGVFMVFFIVYYGRLLVNAFFVTMLSIYFLAAFSTIISLIRTILPRFRRDTGGDSEADLEKDPTFFGGIRMFSSWTEYHTYMETTGADEEQAARMLSKQIHALGIINWKKNFHLRWGMYSFIAAIGAELLMILSLFVKMGLEALAS